MKLAPSDINFSFILEHCQFPVRLAYSMTINKAQGQTFSKVGIDLPIPLFSHGQLYVASSKQNHLKICMQVWEINNTGQVKQKVYITHNIVYHEVL